MKLSAIMAVFNEGKSAGDTLRRVWQEPLPGIEKEIIIVESNSSDDSRSACKAFTDEISEIAPGSVQLILQERARGKGNAARAALRRATGDIVLIQDADSEYDTRDYKALLAPIVKGDTSFVLGSRHLASGSWQIRKFESSPLKAALLNFGGTLFHTFFNLVYSTRLSDPTTMYKVFKRSCINGVRFEANRFDFDFELVGKLIRLGHIPLEVPISYVSRGFEEGKKVRIFRDPFTWVRAIIRYRFASLYDKSQADDTAVAGESVYRPIIHQSVRCVNGPL